MVQAGRTATFLFKIPLFNRKKATHLERAANVKGFWGFRTVMLSLLRAFEACLYPWFVSLMNHALASPTQRWSKIHNEHKHRKHNAYELRYNKCYSRPITQEYWDPIKQRHK
jgi:hypothetical protein